jgi:hypothetical protein
MPRPAGFYHWGHSNSYPIKEIKFKNDYGAALQIAAERGIHPPSARPGNILNTLTPETIK